MTMYSLVETCTVANIAAQTLRNWISAGAIIPAKKGTTGTGNSHRFSAVQVLAFASAAVHAQEGAPPDRPLGVAMVIARLSEEELEHEFSEGRTFPVPDSIFQRAAKIEDVGGIVPGGLIEPPDGPKALIRKLDLKTLWDEVKGKLEKLKAKPVAARKATAKAK